MTETRYSQRGVRLSYLAARYAKPLEGLRGGDLVHEVQVDVEEVGFAGGRVNDVPIPDLLGECSRCGGAHGGSILPNGKGASTWRESHIVR